MNNNSPKPLLGSSKYPFKLCIVGSGPAGCSLIVRAIRLGIIIIIITITIIIVILIIVMIIIIGIIGDLLSGNSDEGGICMIDKDGTTSSCATLSINITTSITTNTITTTNTNTTS